jgi:hypothetical protein
MAIVLLKLASHELPVSDQATDLQRWQQPVHRFPKKRLDRCAPNYDIRAGRPDDRLRQAADQPLQIPSVERLEMIANQRSSIDPARHTEHVRYPNAGAHGGIGASSARALIQPPPSLRAMSGGDRS